MIFGTFQPPGTNRVNGVGYCVVGISFIAPGVSDGFRLIGQAADGGVGRLQLFLAGGLSGALFEARMRCWTSRMF